MQTAHHASEDLKVSACAGTKYQVIDNQTGYVVGTYSSRKLASRKADKLDLQYGAIRYGVKAINAYRRPSTVDQETAMDLRTSCICPPIPTRDFDWSAYDYNTLDGDWDGEKYICPKNHFVGYGQTEEEAIIAWVRILLDNADITITEIW